MKRLFALVIALSIIFSLSASAFAAGSPVNFEGDMLDGSFAHYETVQAKSTAKSAYTSALCDLVEDYLTSHDLTVYFAAYASPNSIGISMEPVGNDIDAFTDAYVKRRSGATANTAYIIYIKSTNEYRYRLSFAEGSDIKVDWAAVGNALTGDSSDLIRVKNAFEVISSQGKTNKVYYADALVWAREKGIVDSSFSLDAACTRAEAVTFMWRALGSVEFPSGTTSFADVPESSKYYKAVTWAYRAGVTTGISAVEFAPDAVCTRAQIVTMLWRAMGKPAVTEEVKLFGETFDDVGAQTYYSNAVTWASVKGITNGTGGGCFSPDYECTQCQIITFLYRLLG